MKRSVIPFLATAAAATLALTGCSGSAAEKAEQADGRIGVTAAFYPLQYALERIGGDHVHAMTLTKPGAEPHDVELTPRDVADLGKSSLVVYEKGFQPAVDDAVGNLDPAAATLDVATAVDLTIEAADDGHDHAGEDHAHEGVDPHFWLDPTRYAKAVTAIATKLAAVDQANATAYTQNAAAFVTELTALDGEFTAALKNCASRELVTGHAAFAYLADRYDLHQEGIAGLSPDAEPNAAAMKSIVEHVREHKVSTVYAETLVSKDLTETIAKETGATVAVLDPLEGLSDASAGTNYLEVMRSNLATLKQGQGCS
ncbi:metal ABC transporter substrate-binding protein [Knoellia subterranea]|uniref:ABC transporter substrate-binding protein n=1 Tax=Knoellia subterranea KCTC 19937 TaxID=1385521 RepID=A0A0A0JQR0_9MICO|nr:metal ABC transporter substrate-binding protein [Knoellia subterranea]KGN39039.1 ABC transporter substrate-binding protein [Knoellia subterranea KCTC 19937]